MDPVPLEAVTFDAAGTLIHLAEPVGASYGRVAAAHGIEAEAPELTEAFGRVWKRTPLPFAEESHIADPNEKEWWRRIVRDVFLEAGATLPGGEPYDAFFEDLYDHFESPGTWVADPDAHEVVATVARHYRVALLSNFDARLRRILDDLGLLASFEALCLSCEIGASKPDPRIFAAASEALGVPAPAILHVGDDPTCDWQGAADAGFRVHRVGSGHGTLRGLFGQLSLA